MSVEGNKDAVRRFFRAIDARDTAGLDALLASDYRLYLNGGPDSMDREGFKHFATAFTVALPDVRHTVEDQLGEGDRIATRLTITGTHGGELMGVPATGRHVTLSALNIIRFKDGQLAEHWISFDVMGLMQQLGAVPAAG